MPMFAGLSGDEVAAVAKLGTERSVASGDMLIEQGRFGTEFFVIAEGQALIYINDMYVSSVGEGSVVGEMALIERRPRNATVVAETDLTVAVFGLDEFRTVLDRYPTANLRVREVLNRRLRENSDREAESVPDE